MEQHSSRWTLFVNGGESYHRFPSLSSLHLVSLCFRFTTWICPRQVLIVGIVEMFRIVSAIGISRMIKMLAYFVQLLY